MLEILPAPFVLAPGIEDVGQVGPCLDVDTGFGLETVVNEVQVRRRARTGLAQPGVGDEPACLVTEGRYRPALGMVEADPIPTSGGIVPGVVEDPLQSLRLGGPGLCSPRGISEPRTGTCHSAFTVVDAVFPIRSLDFQRSAIVVQFVCRGAGTPSFYLTRFPAARSSSRSLHRGMWQCLPQPDLHGWADGQSSFDRYTPPVAVDLIARTYRGLCRVA